MVETTAGTTLGTIEQTLMLSVHAGQVQIGNVETLDGGQGRQEPLGEHQGLGHDVHQDFVALPVAKEGSTLILHQRGRRAPHQVWAASRHCLQRL